ncbi:sulfatase [Alteromonas sp. BMJM2]|uniref:sulfatase n=1 Tax=Alteromonas sp. BMJM2 TaxID=2954241 RepID=UPI0022B587B8|nr:sulfatase-like hydrolase/transferase [Alteromonas sp. BMJM2]
MHKAFIFFGLLVLCMPALSQQPKNVIFILADDLGWNDTSIYQPNKFYETPNIDALAQKGMTFTHAFSNSPLCSPTRASILTGQTPARHNILNPNINNTAVRLTALEQSAGPSDQPATTPLTATRLDTSLPTLAKVLKTKNYQTAHFGKWHLGASPYSALEHGFDIDIPHFSGPSPTGGYLAPWSFAPNLEPDIPLEHIDMRLAKEAKQWIAETHANGPFFVNFWPFSVHAPFSAKADYVTYFREKRSPFNSQRSATYAAMIKHFDDAIGILYSALVNAGIEKDTIIVFTSDNGGNMYDVLGEIHPTSNFPLRGGKATQYSGGNRVPTFIIWPGLTQKNTISETPIQTVDFYPTLLRGLNIDLPNEHLIDGTDIRPILTGDTIDMRPIITYYPTMPRIPDWLPPSATIMYDGWKLIKTFFYGEGEPHRHALYNMVDDIDETVNLANAATDKRDELDSLLTSYLMLSGAALPLQNPDYQQGAFNFDSIGNSASKYRLPEDRVSSKLTLNINASRRQASAGDKITLSWELLNTEGKSQVDYQQFMGPDISVEATRDRLSFIAPVVSTSQFISFAFIAQDSVKTIRKQIAVQILPVNSPPTIRILNNSLSATAGSSVSIEYKLSDTNKDLLSLQAVSASLSLNEAVDVTQSTYGVSIPKSFSGKEASLKLTVSDGDTTDSETLIISVSQPKAESNTPDNSSTPDTSNGGSIFWSIPVLWIFLRARSYFGSKA